MIVDSKSIDKRMSKLKNSNANEDKTKPSRVFVQPPQKTQMTELEPSGGWEIVEKSEVEEPAAESKGMYSRVLKFMGAGFGGS